MKHADRPVGVVFLFKVQQHVQKQAAVFASAERDINIFKFSKQEMKPFLQSLIYIFLLIFPNHFPLLSLIPQVLTINHSEKCRKWQLFPFMPKTSYLKKALSASALCRESLSFCQSFSSDCFCLLFYASPFAVINLMMITAHSALLAVPCGSSCVWLYFPVMMPFPTAHSIASMAKSLTDDAS